MSSSVNFELTISELIVPNYSGPIKCALVLANFSATVSIPTKPLHLINLKLDPLDKLYLSVFTNSSEIGSLEIPYSSFSSSDLDKRFQLYESSVSPEKDYRQLKPTGELLLQISKIDEICQRCEGLEKLVRDIKQDLDEFDDLEHTHNASSKSVTVKEEKKPTGIQKKQNKTLRSGKSVQSLPKAAMAPAIVQSGSIANLATTKKMTQVIEDLDLKKMLEESYKARQELQMSVTATTEQLAENLKEQREALEKALADRAAAMGQMLGVSAEINKLKQENELIRGLIDEKDSTIGSLKPKAASAATFENELSSVSKELEKALQESNELEKKLQDSMNAFGNSNAAMNKRVQDLTNEKAQLMNRIEELAKTNNGLRQENDRYANLTNELLAQIALLQAEVQTARARENREKHLMKMLKEEEEAKSAMKKELDALAKQFSEQTDKLIKDNKRIVEDKNNAESELLILKKKSEEQEKNALRLSKDLEKARSEVVGLEQQVKVLGDQRHMVEQLSLQNADYERKNKNLTDQLKEAEATIEEHEEALRNQSEKITELEAIRIEREEQLLSLENIIDELRKDREIYKPTKDDPIDIALSDYVNTRPAGLKVQFEREDHGIYNFGTKKIFVKLEQGKLLIRVGGGYMQVEDFVKMYSPVELERFSTLKKEQAQKIRQSYLGKYADKLATSKPSGQSPERASKMLKDQMAAGNYTTYYAVQARSPERVSNDRSPVCSERNSRLSN